MADSKFIIDKTITKDKRDAIKEKIDKRIEQMKSEVAEREPILKKRGDFFEGRHHNWTNVVGQTIKQQEGHILAVFNYIYRFCQKLHQTLTNTPPKIKVSAKDESNEIETSRAEAVESAIYDVLKENNFFSVVFKRAAVNQIRDGDFVLECKVMEGPDGKKKIVISQSENLAKVAVGWDDASGSSFSFVYFSDNWSVDKIKREFGYDAEPISEQTPSSPNAGSHLTDQYGLFSTTYGATTKVPSGQSMVPKSKITDYWGYEVFDDGIKVINAVFIGKEMVQIVKTDYKEIPKLIGHSLIDAGKPWSISFIDPLIDPQIELNDRSSEEGDLIRVGAHMKFKVINMPDFDPDSIKPGSGQVIFIEGEGADFQPLQMTISPFPSADYINRVLDHMYSLGLPKISLASGSLPYTGRIGALLYQPLIDLTQDYRIQWEIVMRQLVKMIQQYFIDYFPETHTFMRESIYDETSQTYSEGQKIIRDIEFDWENVMPLTKSDKIVDASTMRDRGAISLYTYLTQAGFRDPSKEIKKLKKEMDDPEMVSLMTKFSQFSKGAVQATLEAQKETANQEENNAANQGATVEAATAASQPAKAPLQNPSQNEGRRGSLTATGTPTGATASPRGQVAQTGQNTNAKAGV